MTTIVIVASDLVSGKVDRRVFYRLAGESITDTLRRAKDEFIHDPNHMWNIAKVWQVIEGGKE